MGIRRALVATAATAACALLALASAPASPAASAAPSPARSPAKPHPSPDKSPAKSSAKSPATSPATSPPASPAKSTAASSAPLPNSYVQKVTCVHNGSTGKPLDNGVSWAQTQLDYTSLGSLGKYGTGQKIAVIDTGINQISGLPTVKDVADYVVPADMGAQDCDGHGTIVASLIAGLPDAETGFSGVAPEAQLLSIRQSSSDYGIKNPTPTEQNETAGTLDTLAQAINEAVDVGATIINISEANCRPATADKDAPDVVAVQAAVQYAIAHKVVVVAAAGNVDPGVGCATQNTPGAAAATYPSPADVPGVLAVGAVDETGQPASFSLNGKWVGVAAPGVDITASNPVKTGSGQINQLITDQGASPIQGTSFACPYVTGLVALVRARFRYLSPAQVISRIEQTAQHPAAPGGRNDSVGYGMIDPQAALTAVLPSEGDAAVATPTGPSTLPAATRHVDTQKVPRRIALIGSLGLLVLIVAGTVAADTRSRRRDALRAQASAGRALSRAR